MTTEGNIVHINGMSATGTTAGVTVLRPLLKVRKSELIAFADLAHVCYMQDTMMVVRDGNLWNSKFIKGCSGFQKDLEDLYGVNSCEL